MTAKNASKARHHVPAALATAQPWVRDHYSSLRAEAGPHWEHTKTVVVPVLEDAAAKVREDYLPAAAEASSRLAAEATRRSAPYRAELASRGVSTLAAVRGQVTAQDVADLNHRGKGRKRRILGVAALLGAATGAGLLLWQRTHSKSWDEDELAQTTLTDPKTPSSPQPAQPGPSARPAAAGTRTNGTGPGASTSDDDPADPDGGTTAGSAATNAATANANAEPSAKPSAKGNAGLRT
jgi:Family of unknown function (DUF5324)